MQHYDASEGKRKKIINIKYIFFNKYNHTIKKFFRTLPFPC